MPDKITLTYDGAAVNNALRRLYAGLGAAGMRAPLAEIGERVKAATERRFVN